jgi:Fic family protein
MQCSDLYRILEAVLMNYTLPILPLSIDLETKAVLQKLTTAHQALAELKGFTGVIPNQSILMNTLSLQEAKEFCD